MRSIRLALSVAVLTAVLVACKAGGGGASGVGGNVTNANAAPGTAPAPGTLVADPDDIEAAIFHDDVTNQDLVQVLAWDDSSHTGVFLSVPAAMVAQPGTNVLTATTPGVFGRFGVSHEGRNSDCNRQWYFGLYSGSLVVAQGAAQPGDTIAVSMSNAVFEFVDEHGSVNPAITANLAMTSVLSATLGDEAIYRD